jgi:methyl-accepting chemotaxis protein/ligand-binding sensor domain-containing protein
MHACFQGVRAVMSLSPLLLTRTSFAIFFLCISLCLPFKRLQAQHLNVELYQSKQGLSVNLTKAIAQDNFNFVWIGTDEGLIKFDGNRFYHYPKALSSNYVKSLYRTRSGRLLVVHDMGVAEIVSAPDTVAFVPIVSGAPERSDATTHYPKSIFEDEQGALWIGESQTILRLSPDGALKRFNFPAKCMTESFLRSFSFAPDGFGSFVVVSQTGYVFRFDRASDSFVEIALPTRLPASSAALKVAQGKIWIASSEEIAEIVLRADGSTVRARTLVNFAGGSSLHIGADGSIYAGSWARGLYRLQAGRGGIEARKVAEYPLNNVNMIAGNRSGEIWLSSDEGICLLKPTFFTPILIPNSRNFIQSIVRDGANKALYTTDGDKIFRLNETTREATTIFEAKGKNVLAMAFAGGSLWFGASGGNVYRIEKNGQTRSFSFGSGMSYAVLPNADGSAWVCADIEVGLLKLSPSGAFETYSRQKGLTAAIRVVKYSPQGALFAGGRGRKGYLFRYNAATDSFTDVSRPLPFAVGEDFEVADIAFTGETALLATNYGLLLYDADGVRAIPLVNPYTGDEIRTLKSLTFDGEGALWIGASEGLALLANLANNEVVMFDEESGLPANSISLRASYWDAETGLWIGTTKGLARAREAFKRRVSRPPLLTGVRVNGQIIPLSGLQQGEVFGFESNIQIEFTAVVYPGNNVRYQYRVVGMADTSWSKPQRETELTLLKLPHAAYRLEIRALQQGGYVWSKPLYYSFVIAKAWYQHWWLWIGVIAIATMLVWGVIHLNARRLTQQNERLETTVRERTESVKQEKERAERALIEAERAKELAEEARNMIAKEKQYLAESVETMLRAIERLASGDFTVHLEVQSNDDIGRLARGINEMAANVREMMARVTEAAERVAESVKIIAASGSVMAQAAQRQSRKADEVMRAMDNAAEMIQHNATQASANAEIAGEGERAAEEGKEIIRQTVEKIRRIANAMGASSATINRLGEASAQIGEIAQVIQEIADQTNLLALNAAIEAARAGEQGRGFAVVADEVRKLAERTAKATKEISATIRTALTGTEEAAAAMRVGNAEMQEGIALADKTGAALAIIAQSIQKNVAMLEALAQAGATERQTTKQMSENVRDIQQAIREAEREIEGVTHAVADLNALTDNLQNSIERFRF